jgi:hypothetical protein
VYQGVKTRVDRNVILFSDFRGYGSESAIRFEPEPGSGTGDSTQAAPSGLLNHPSEHKAAPVRRRF